jgi:hypothetical protein
MWLWIKNNAMRTEVSINSIIGAMVKTWVLFSYNYINEDGDSPVDRAYLIGVGIPPEIEESHDAISGPMNPSWTAVSGWNSVAKSCAKARIVAVD